MYWHIYKQKSVWANNKKGKIKCFIPERRADNLMAQKWPDSIIAPRGTTLWEWIAVLGLLQIAIGLISRDPRSWMVGFYSDVGKNISETMD